MTASHINVPVQTDVFLSLVDFLRKQGSDRDPVATVTTAIEYWMDNASWKQADLMPEIFETGGYRWKEVFLPHGTMLRIRFKGAYHYAKVLGDQILYEDKPVSPSEFANAVTKTTRNAWRDLEVRRPGDAEWLPAGALRADKSNTSDGPTVEELGL
ncbi:MAG TPA: hypothetical protein VD995_32585 [Azospirillum sp.]|nr:hypothetical protein [Azospirillum sp.]